jgi:hypothetical protein
MRHFLSDLLSDWLGRDRVTEPSLVTYRPRPGSPAYTGGLTINQLDAAVNRDLEADSFTTETVSKPLIMRAIFE